tara:strand:- start:282 stop:428 length:147 start_codon:yes stop_codon:yes gene_type:complete
MEPIGRLDHCTGKAVDQVMGLANRPEAIDYGGSTIISIEKRVKAQGPS